jgi:alpha-methylacyl-CoA racemase
MLLADMGAEVVTITRPQPRELGIPREPRFNLTARSRGSIAIDLKNAAGREIVLRMMKRAHALVEGHRPGVMERLGLDPDTCLSANPTLVYGRMTGWGQSGPLAMTVGHDLNYLAITGVLSLFGSNGKPPAIPLNLIADLGGGGTFLALGILAAIMEAKTSGKGQIVDVAMVDGIGSLLTHMFSFFSSGRWIYEREMNFLDGGAPWYNTYETSDGKYVSVAAVERKFFDELLTAMGLLASEIPDQLDRETWPQLKERFAAIFHSKTRDEWCDIMDGKETCFAPILSIEEAMRHPHLVARSNFISVEGVQQPAPAPRFSRTPAAVRRAPASPGADTDEILRSWDFTDEEVKALRKIKVIA